MSRGMVTLFTGLALILMTLTAHANLRENKSWIYTGDLPLNDFKYPETSLNQFNILKPNNGWGHPYTLIVTLRVSSAETWPSILKGTKLQLMDEFEKYSNYRQFHSRGGLSVQSGNVSYRLSFYCSNSGMPRDCELEDVFDTLKVAGFKPYSSSESARVGKQSMEPLLRPNSSIVVKGIKSSTIFDDGFGSKMAVFGFHFKNIHVLCHLSGASAVENKKLSGLGKASTVNYNGVRSVVDHEENISFRGDYDLNYKGQIVYFENGSAFRCGYRTTFGSADEETVAVIFSKNGPLARELSKAGVSFQTSSRPPAKKPCRVTGCANF